MKTIVIEILGGVVQDVYADEGTRIVVVDWDDHEANHLESCSGELKPHPLSLMPEEAEKYLELVP